MSWSHVQTTFSLGGWISCWVERVAGSWIDPSEVGFETAGNLSDKPRQLHSTLDTRAQQKTAQLFVIVR